MSLYTNLKWDSDFFGFNVAKLNTNNIDDAQLKATLNELKNKNYKLIYWSVSPDNYNLNKIAINNKGFLIDKKTTYSTNFKDKFIADNNPNIIEYTDSVPNQELISLALQCGSYSRFKIDKNFIPNRYNDLYSLWINNSLQKRLADIVFVYTNNNNLHGLITLYSVNNIGNIGLIGVDDNYRGKSIGTELINSAKRYFFNKNIFIMNVVTQLDNKIACKFYEKCGFKIIKIENYYHFWL